MNADLAPVASILKRHQSFVLTTHVNPDGDGLGCELALASWLTKQGKRVDIINFSPTPETYRFLDAGKIIQQFSEEEHGHSIQSADVIVVLDTNTLQRLQTMERHVAQSPAIKACIDHHLDPSPFASAYLIDADATSTGEIVYKLLTSLTGKEISPAIAQSLYCAIMTDTGSFRYPRVDPEVHTIVAHLIESGADPVSIYQEVYERWTAGRIQLLGNALAAIKTQYEGTLAHMTITQEMLRKTNTTIEDTDNFTVYPMSIVGVNAGIVFIEAPTGIKISFRSKGDIPINELAREFGGGGHKNAAGTHVNGKSLSEVRSDVLSAAGNYLNSKKESERP